jgi:hypothetical protein
MVEIGATIEPSSISHCNCGCGCSRRCSCGCDDSSSSLVCGCSDRCGPGACCRGEGTSGKEQADEQLASTSVPSAPKCLDGQGSSGSEGDIKIIVQPESSCEGAATFDLAADRALRKKESMWCYGTSMILTFLLLTMIIVWPPLRYFPPSSIQYQGSARRIHYIAAEYVQWTYTDGDNRCYANGFGGPGPDNTPGSDLSTINGTLRKAIFRAYSDVYFKTPLDRDPKWQHLGILGPAILAEAGDTIDIFFMNKLDFPLNIEPAGPDWSPVAGLLPAVVVSQSHLSYSDASSSDDILLYLPLILSREEWSASPGWCLILPHQVPRTIKTAASSSTAPLSAQRVTRMQGWPVPSL